MGKAAPCPFCGAGEMRMDEQSYWTGMISQIISVTLRHWCEKSDDEFIAATITIRARSAEDALERWNARH